MKRLQTLKSQLDASVNFITKREFPGFVETRFVQRVPEYFICYLSSQTGCKQACRMCHLTATRQTALVNVDREGFIEQASCVIDYYETLKERKATSVYFNFMARGEPLENEHLISKDYRILLQLSELAFNRGLHPRFNISTIMPMSIRGKPLLDMFPVIYPEIYYSIYSTKDSFRKRWLNHAMPVRDAVVKLRIWQQKTKKIIKLHFCFIEGENDSEDDMLSMCHLLNRAQLRVDFNIVRYNPYSKKYGQESSLEVIAKNIGLLKENLPATTRIDLIDRVGFDVKGSCGQFIE